MNWPGMGDPTKRKKTLKFLGITAIIAISVGVGSSLIQGQMNLDNPLKVCINDRDTPYKITATLELHVDGNKADVPANIGFDNVEEDGLFDSVCQRTLYTITDDGVIYAEWEEEYPFEIGHFLWIWEFPIKDMDNSKTRVIIDGKETDEGIHVLLKDGSVYKAEFYSEGFDQSEESDFLPPDL